MLKSFTNRLVLSSVVGLTLFDVFSGGTVRNVIGRVFSGGGTITNTELLVGSGISVAPLVGIAFFTDNRDRLLTRKEEEGDSYEI